MKSNTLFYSILALGGAFALVQNAAATLIFSPIDITLATGTTTSQTTTHPAGPSDNGVDGNTGNFTHTNGGDPSPSWTADLGRDETFNVIVVHNRDSCCAERLSDITVQVFDSAANEVYNSGPTNVGNELGTPGELRFELPALVTGRSITVSRDPASTPDSGILSIGELQIGTIEDVVLPPGTNLTRSALALIEASQSPDAANPPGSGFAANGIDGNVGNFTHTTTGGAGGSHWWQVDFGEEMSLESVDILNRANCCGERLRDITVSVLDAGGSAVFTSDLLNPGNELGFTGINQGGLTLNLVELNGGSPVVGQTVVITRTPDPGGANAHDMSVVSVGEVTVIGGTASGGDGFRVTRFEQVPGTDRFQLSWPAQAGTTYAVYFASDLNDLQAGGDVGDDYVDNGAGDLDPTEGAITIEFPNPAPGAPDLFFTVFR